MPVPAYQTLMLPLLEFIASRAEVPARDCVEAMSAKFELSPEEREELLPSGRQTVIANRTHWAITYMAQAGLVVRPRRGVVAISARGREVLSRKPSQINNAMLAQFSEFKEFKSRTHGPAERDVPEATQAVAVDSGTPEESIEAAQQELNTELRAELLARIMQASPTFFEHLIIDLMVAMGYGGAGSSQHLGRSGDGGADGIISEDPLGLDNVYLQAKRYAADNAIGVEKIREFAGTLDERGATKGVFVTTSRFAAQARTYAQRSPKKLVLIDGAQLTELLVKYGVGVRTVRAIEIKRIDADYFVSDEID
jgi:restriction system protein